MWIKIEKNKNKNKHIYNQIESYLQIKYTLST